MDTSSKFDCSATILLPLDQVGGGETKIPIAIRYARMMGAQVVLLHVLPPHTLDPSTVLPDEARARAHTSTRSAPRFTRPAYPLLPSYEAAHQPASSSTRLTRSVPA